MGSEPSRGGGLLHANHPVSVKARDAFSSWSVWIACLCLFGLAGERVHADGLPVVPVPQNLEVSGMPSVPVELKARVEKYLKLGGAGFRGWNSVRREPVVTTRLGETVQLHLVAGPAGKRTAVTRWKQPVTSGVFQPGKENRFVFSSDVNGNEQFQIYLGNAAVPSAPPILLTDGKSRNLLPRWSPDGALLAYTSDRRNGRDSDVFVVDPSDPLSTRNLTGASGLGFGLCDWSRDRSRLLVSRDFAGKRTELWTVDVASGEHTLITKKAGDVVYSQARFAENDTAVYALNDSLSDFQSLVRLEVASGRVESLTERIPWDVEAFEISSDGRILAFVTNEDGFSKLRLIDVVTRLELPCPALPRAVLKGLAWHPRLREVGFSISGSQGPSDVYSIEVDSGVLTRWTERPAGSSRPPDFVEAELVRVRSFDGLPLSGLVYRPDPERFPGPRPVIVSIHGGPSGQTRPDFRGSYNYFVNELGVALLYPNVRGSSGYGRKFLDMDNGFKREDAVKDIGAFLDWVGADSGLRADRTGVMGGSYGGYMSLACLVRYREQFCCGIDSVGIANFNTFLRDTSDYRRSNRRREYGDERDPKMHAFLESISPLTHAAKIKAPLFVVQGRMDPRVPYTEAERIVSAVRESGLPTWYLLGKDEGHGFTKRNHEDYQFLSYTLFFEKFLLDR